MEEIGAGEGGGRVWHSNRSAGEKGGASKGTRAAGFQPMLATSGSSVPTSGDWTFEPKYDGIRVLAYATADSVALVTRNGNDKTKQFPEIADDLRALVAALSAPIVLDGEIVA